jgi:hypothetical protein
VLDESTQRRRPGGLEGRHELGMTDPASLDTPVAIDRVDRTRGDGDGIRLRLTGRWLGPGEAEHAEPLLVVQLQGRRHRFPPTRDEGARPLAPGAWEANFTLPSWAEPRQDGQAALWVGNTVVPVPLPGSVASMREPVGHEAVAGPEQYQPPASPALGEARAWPPAPPALGEARAWQPVPPLSPAALPDPSVDTGRTGPLADLLFKESVAALHSELEHRSAEAASLRGSLADAQSELEARKAMQSALESAHADLRDELTQLMAAVGGQRDEFEQRLSAIQERLTAAESKRDRLAEELESERERARIELESERERVRAELESERERVRIELESERSHAAQQLADLTAAHQAQLAEAAALRDRVAASSAAQQQRAAEVTSLREQLASAHVSRDAAAGEVIGLRAELERLGSELAVSREQFSAHGGDLGDAQRLLAEARALNEQLRGESSH